MLAFERWRPFCCLAYPLLITVLVPLGCRSPGGWFSFGRERTSDHAPATERPPPAAPRSAYRGLDGKRATVASGAAQTVQLRFEVLRIELPIESVRHSLKIWNHVDELRMAPELVGLLARNGIRVGASSPGAWPAIRTVFDAAGARVRVEQFLPRGNAPVVIDLAEVADAETIFRYDLDHDLVGKTFPGGTKRIKLDYAFHPELGGCTELRLTLEVRHELGTATWEHRGGPIREMPSIEHHTFSDLVAGLTLNPSEFLIIGPGERAAFGYLVGSRFFTYERDGGRFETLLCITPQPYQTEPPKRERV